MKNQKAIWVIAFLMTLEIVLSLYSLKMIKNVSGIPGQNKTILDGVSALKTATYNMEINKPLIDRIDYLTRENVALLNEVGDLENQIQEFGWIKKSE